MVGEIVRFKRVAVSGLDRDGSKIRLEGEGLFAQCLQHEIDHLNGELYVDRARDVRRRPKTKMKRRRRQASDGSAEPSVDRDALLRNQRVCGAEPARRSPRDSDLAGVVTQPDAPAGRGHKLAPCPVKAAALELGLARLRAARLGRSRRQLDGARSTSSRWRRTAASCRRSLLA